MGLSPFSRTLLHSITTHTTHLNTAEQRQFLATTLQNGVAPFSRTKCPAAVLKRKKKKAARETRQRPQSIGLTFKPPVSPSNQNSTGDAGTCCIHIPKFPNECRLLHARHQWTQAEVLCPRSRNDTYSLLERRAAVSVGALNQRQCVD